MVPRAVIAERRFRAPADPAGLRLAVFLTDFLLPGLLAFWLFFVILEGGAAQIYKI